MTAAAVCAAVLAALTAVPAQAHGPDRGASPHWALKDTGTPDVRFRGLSAAGRDTAWLPHSRTAALAVGPAGTDLTTDGGRTWRTVDTGSYDTVDCASGHGRRAAGEKGGAARLEH